MNLLWYHYLCGVFPCFEFIYIYIYINSKYIYILLYIYIYNICIQLKYNCKQTLKYLCTLIRTHKTDTHTQTQARFFIFIYIIKAVGLEKNQSLNTFLPAHALPILRQFVWRQNAAVFCREGNEFWIWISKLEFAVTTLEYGDNKKLDTFLQRFSWFVLHKLQNHMTNIPVRIS